MKWEVFHFKFDDFQPVWNCVEINGTDWNVLNLDYIFTHFAFAGELFPSAFRLENAAKLKVLSIIKKCVMDLRYDIF